MMLLTYTIVKDINLFISYDITLDLQTYARLNKCLLVKSLKEKLVHKHFNCSTKDFFTRHKTISNN